MTRSTAFGLYDGHVAGVIERQKYHLSNLHPICRVKFFMSFVQVRIFSLLVFERGLAIETTP